MESRKRAIDDSDCLKYAYTTSPYASYKLDSDIRMQNASNEQLFQRKYLQEQLYHDYDLYICYQAYMHYRRLKSARHRIRHCLQQIETTSCSIDKLVYEIYQCLTSQRILAKNISIVGFQDIFIAQSSRVLLLAQVDTSYQGFSEIEVARNKKTFGKIYEEAKILIDLPTLSYIPDEYRNQAIVLLHDIESNAFNLNNSGVKPEYTECDQSDRQDELSLRLNKRRKTGLDD